MKTIKDKIRQHLAKVTESTAKKIGAAIGMKDYPSDVVKALSEMRTDTEVECEKRKGSGNELWYWLTNVTANGCVSDSTESETQSALTATDETQMPVDKECCNAAKVVATTAGSEVAKLRDEIVSKSMRIEALEADQSYRDGVIAELKAKLGHAQIQIDALNEQLMNGEEAVDVKDAAKGYLVCAPKRKPVKLGKAESAVARAKAAAKATGRCEVFALVPVGIATRKQIKAVEFKECAA